MKVGDVVFFRKDSSFISRAVSFLTSSSFSHVGIIYRVEEEGIVVAEALASGFNLRWYNAEDFMLNIISGRFTLKRGKIDKKRAIASIENKIGRPYGFVDLLRIFVYKITGRRLGKESAERLICSEAVARVLFASNKRIDLRKEFNKPFGYITPDDLFMSKHLKMAEVKIK